MKRRLCLVWLEWPEKCFRVNAKALRLLATLLPRGAQIKRVRSERAFLRELPRATDALVWNFRREWYQLAPRLKLVATPAAGRELVSREAPPGVMVHFGGFHGVLMAETVAAFVLAWARGFFRPELQDYWARVALSDKCYTVAGTRAVIVGYGRVGRAVGAKLAALGVKVRGFTRANLSGLAAAARSADWFIQALPADTGTDDFFNARMMARLPRRCVFINIGRGNSVDEAALLAGLRRGRLAGAYLDVFKQEPTEGRSADPEAKSVIMKLPRAQLPGNLIVSPHFTAFAADYLERFMVELHDAGLL